MDTRERKGLELAARARIERQRTYWSVPSSDAQAGGYKVNPEATTCTCPDFDLRRLPCKHVFAVRLVMEREKGGPPPTEAPEPPKQPDPAAPPRKPTYRQNWPAYNAAQTGEKRFFLELLADLCDLPQEKWTRS